ncbi:MAG: hypothetical protein QM564_05710 [Bergeyella sp.]
MKNLTASLFLILIAVFSCGKKQSEIVSAENTYTPAPYDTTAVDSFSAGAVSVDVARQIKISSRHYQDSLRQVLLAQEEERKNKAEMEKLEKAAQEALEKEKKKAEASAPKTETPQNFNTGNP